MIEKGLNQHNIMPGTERYTRPEEVKALNKFLKSVKEIQEEHTSLEENNLELPRVPKVNDLDSRRVNVSGDIKKVDRLEEGRLGIHGKEIKNLSVDRENLIDSRENNLDDSKVTIEDSRDPKLSMDIVSLNGGDSVDLEETRVDLRYDSENNLNDSKVILEDQREIKLQETKLEIETPEVKDLWKENIKIDPTPQDKELENHKETIDDARENSLENIVLNINAPEIDDLKTSRVNIENTKEIKNLETNRETIETPEVNNLPKYSINISGAKEYELEDTRLNITGNEISDLPDILEKIKTSELKNLPEDKERIETPEITHLSEDRENIETPEVNNLEVHRENIEIREIGSLEDFVDTIETKQNPGLSEEIKTISPRELTNLSETTETIETSEITHLSEDRENIEVPETRNLETKRENIEIEEVGELENDIKTIQGKEISDLANSSISISPEELKNLETRRETIETPEITHLSEDRENIEVPEVNNLENHLEIIEQKEIGALEDKIETLSSPNQITFLPNESLSIQSQDISSLEEKRIDITSAQNIDSLPSGSESITQENKIEGLENHREDLVGTSEISSLETKIIEGPERIEKELETTKLDISENPVESLEDTLVQGPITNNPKSLENKTITVESNEIDSLEDFILGLNDPRENNLETKVIQEPTRNEPESLEETIISLGKPGDQELENHREDLEDTREESLEDTLIDLKGVSGYTDERGSNFFWEDKLREEKLSRPVDPGISGRTTTLEDYKLSDVEIKDTMISSPGNADLLGRTYRDGYGYKTGDILETKIIEGPEENEQDLEETVIDRPINSDQTNRTLTDSEYEVSEIEDLIDTYLKRPGNTEHPRKTESFSDKYEEAKENLESGRIIRPESFDEFDESLEEEKLKRPDDFTEKNTELSKEIIGELVPVDSSLEEDYLETPGYKLPKIGWKNFWSGGALNPSTYLRWAVDNTVGRIPLKGAMKRKLIDETLQFLIWGREALEKKTKANRDRLPGGDMGILSDLVGGSLSVKSAAKSVLGAAGKALSKATVDRSQPLNRPKDEKDKQEKWEAIGQYVWDTVDPIDEKKGSGNFFKDVGKSLMGGSLNNASESETRKFSQMMDRDRQYKNPGRVIDDDYIGFGQTINDLISSTADLTSLEDFKKALRESRYITTPEKFTTTKNSTNYMTLDSNHVWEIIVKPYLGKSNGYMTWLPSFLEIDVQNKAAFNMTTSFSRGWLPITGFELQDKKLTSKELPLFDGSISFPVGLEFTNELRLTFADDSLKSLRRYFDLCAKVSAYMSNIHVSGENGYGSASENEKKNTESDFSRTVYLEGKIHPGLYKNLSFLITIFILTPQYGTIKKCNLLCVLKDYTIENQGETDASPTELSVTFSIVGENPEDGINLQQESVYTPAKKTGQTDRTGEGILDNLGSVVDIF